jgi:GNAT superfamily N-acetyltransferase
MENRARILLFGCLPEYRRMGVGRALIEYAIDCCSEEADVLDFIIMYGLT